MQKSQSNKPTRRQVEFVAYIYYYSRIHGRAPAEHDIGEFFKISPPSVHQMILTFEKKGLISRVPGEARSIRITVPDDELRELKRLADFWNRRYESALAPLILLVEAVTQCNATDWIPTLYC